MTGLRFDKRSYGQFCSWQLKQIIWKTQVSSTLSYPEELKIIYPLQFGIRDKCETTHVIPLLFLLFVNRAPRACNFHTSPIHFSSLVNLYHFLLVCRRPISPVDRLSVSWAGNLEFKLRPDHQLFKTLSQFRWSCHCAVTFSRCLLHPNKSIERGCKESLTLFPKCRCWPSVMVYLTGAVNRLVGWGEITHGLKRLNSAP